MTDPILNSSDRAAALDQDANARLEQIMKKPTKRAGKAAPQPLSWIKSGPLKKSESQKPKQEDGAQAAVGRKALSPQAQREAAERRKL